VSDQMLPEISCRLTKTLLLYVRESNGGSLGGLMDGLAVDQAYLMDTNNWVSHDLVQELYHRMIGLLGDERAVYKMALASERFQSLGLLDRIARLIGSPKLIYNAAPTYNKMLKKNGEVSIRDSGENWVLLEDRYLDPAQKTRFDCDYTRGILAGIPTIFGLPRARVQEVQCQVMEEVSADLRWPENPEYSKRGCLYRVRWNERSRVSFLKRIFNRRKLYQKAIEDLRIANRDVQRKYKEAKELSARLDAANIELAASEKQFRLLAENVSDVIWTYSLIENRFTYTSPAVTEMRGFTVEEALGLSLQETLDQESMGKVINLIQEELAKDRDPGVDKGRSRTLLIKQTVKDGTYAWGEVKATFVRDKSGVPIGLQGITRDITARKHAEDALKKSEAIYRSLFETSGDYICLHDLKGDILKINPAAARAAGLPADALVGRNFSEFMPPKNRTNFKKFYLPEILSQGRAEGVTKMQKPSGEIRYVEYHNDLVKLEGEPPYVIALGRDITERVSDKRQLEQLETQLQHSQKMQAVGTLAGGVAHDFNNILQAISGSIYLMGNSPTLGQDDHKRLHEIYVSVERAKSLVQQLLTFSRKVEPEFRALSLNDEVENAVRILERTIPKMISIQTDLQPDLDKVFGDAVQLEQVVLNLGSNAKDAMPEGGKLSITTRNLVSSKELRKLHPELAEKAYVLLSVSDEGTGIHPQNLEKIYDPFFTTKPLGQGTGLGLSTAFGIIKAHRGNILCHSNPGQGTTFELFFPAADLSDDGYQLDSVAGAGPKPAGKGQTVLVVDDEETIVQTMSEVLSLHGYDVQTAISGESALELTRSMNRAPSLVVLDLGMPGMGGMRCLEELVGMNPDIKVLIASGYSEHAREEHLMASGASGFIRKPFDMKSLLDKVSQLV
jgi:two-component system cell cycle sensor histidine kinase/response regulator CckA